MQPKKIYKSRNYSGGLDLKKKELGKDIYKSRNYSGGLDAQCAPIATADLQK